jgi:hypothetical protein
VYLPISLVLVYQDAIYIKEWTWIFSCERFEI